MYSDKGIDNYMLLVHCNLNSLSMTVNKHRKQTGMQMSLQGLDLRYREQETWKWKV